MTHFIGGSSLCLGEETSSGIGEGPGTIKHSSCAVTTIPILFSFRKRVPKAPKSDSFHVRVVERRNLDFESKSMIWGHG